MSSVINSMLRYTLPLYVAGFKGGLKGIGLALPESVSCDFWLPLGSAWCRGVCVLSFVRVAQVGGISCQFSGCNLLFLPGCTAWMSIQEGLCSGILISVTLGRSLMMATICRGSGLWKRLTRDGVIKRVYVNISPSV